MNVQLNLQEITDTFGSIYKCIDIRTAALKQRGSWMNIVTVVRFSYESRELIGNFHSDLRVAHSFPDLDDFRIFLSSKFFTDWGDLCAELRTSALVKHDSAEVKLTSGLDILSQTGYLNRQHMILKERPSGGWPACEISLEHRLNEWEQLGLGNRL